MEAPSQDPEAVSPPAELHEHLSDTESFVLCDARAHGLPVRFASKGFKEMFECAKGEAWALLGCGRLLTDPAELRAAAALADLSLEETAEALQWLERLLLGAARKVARATKLYQSDFAWVVRLGKGGPFICEVSLILRKHPTLGWPYIMALHQDVSQQVSVRRLLRAVAAGSGQALLDSLRNALEDRRHFREALLKLPEETQALDEAIGEMWRGLAEDLNGHGSRTIKLAKKGSSRSISSRDTADSRGSSRRSMQLMDEVCSESRSSCPPSTPATPSVEQLPAAAPGRFLDLLEPPPSPEQLPAAAPGRLLDLLEWSHRSDGERRQYTGPSSTPEGARLRNPWIGGGGCE